jgi:hypothetical protein
VRFNVATKIQRLFFVLGVANGAISLVLIISGLLYFLHLKSLFLKSNSPDGFAVNMSIAAALLVLIITATVTISITIACMFYYNKGFKHSIKTNIISLLVIIFSVASVSMFALICIYILYCRLIS